jgi:hypothetical protein
MEAIVQEDFGNFGVFEESYPQGAGCRIKAIRWKHFGPESQ